MSTLTFSSKHVKESLDVISRLIAKEHEHNPNATFRFTCEAVSDTDDQWWEEKVAKARECSKNGEVATDEEVVAWLNSWTAGKDRLPMPKCQPK